MTEAIELRHKAFGNVLLNAEADLKDGLYKILVPKGTHLWYVSVNAYKVDEPATALLSMDAPPVAPGTPSGSDTRKTLSRLWAGETISFFSPANSGSLTISTPENTDPFRADRDRWLFLQIDFAGEKTLRWESRIVLHEGTAPPPSPPETDEARTLALVQQAGLVPALNTFGACTSDADLIDRAVSSGVWAGLIELVRLSQER